MLHIYSVYDQKSEIWSNPMFMRANGEAVRAFMDAVRNPDTMISKYPEDYTLFQIGTFDEVTGVLMPVDNPVNLGNGIAFKVSAPSAPLREVKA